MKIFLVRHGESEANVAGIISDNPARIVNLTERGKGQAETAAQKLRAVRFTHAYVSEFARAQQTMSILLQYQDCPLRVDARLNERHSGMDGLPVHMFHDLVRPDPLRVKPERGESFLEQMERLRGFLDDIAARHPDATVLAASHEHPILAAYALTVADPEQVVLHGYLDNCEWIELDWPTLQASGMRFAPA